VSRTAAGAVCPEVENLTLRRDTIVTVLALLVIVVALPFAIVDTFETGRVYVFSRQFIEELPQRFTRPGRLRFTLQPMVAIVLGIRGGLRDAKAGNPPFLSLANKREGARDRKAAVRCRERLGGLLKYYERAAV
jgi:hypothetical protein